MRILRWGQGAFAITMISLGVIGLAQGDFTPIWQPVVKEFPARLPLAYACAIVSLLCGAGLLVPRSAPAASRVLFAWFAAWLVLMRLPLLAMHFGVNTWWATAEVAAFTGAAWVVFATTNPTSRLSVKVRFAQMLFGLAMIPFGLAHFLYVENTAPLVPAWLPWHVAWGYATGAAFIAAGLAMTLAVWARLAAILVTWQIALFTILVWLPIVASGHARPGDWSEFIASYALTACAWVLAESYGPMLQRIVEPVVAA
jgi:uncharacterized membrane protein